MSALAANNANMRTRQGARSMRTAKASTALYGASLVQADTNGVLNPVSSAAGAFAGILPIGSGVLSTAAAGSARNTEVARNGAILATITGITAADINKPVWAPTDNPADLTLTFTAGAKLFGTVLEMDFDSTGAAVANKCWVLFDVFEFGTAMRDVEKTSPALIPIAGTVREAFYKVPTGKNAQLFEINWTQQVKPNFATSATLNLNKISGAARTNLIAGINVNNTGSVDVVTAGAITSAVQTLAAGDILEAEVVTVGGLTTAGKLNVSVNLVEYAKI